MGYARPQRDRRLDPRVDLGGRALLFSRGDPIGRYKLENISAGGALISGDRDLRPGHLVHALLDLATGDEPLRMTASVRQVREASEGVDLAIAFRALSADQEDAIHDAVLRALLRQGDRTRRLPLLVFEPRRRVREELEAEIRSFGLPVHAVGTLGDAVRELEEDDMEYNGLVIHSVIHDPASMDVVEFFACTESLRTIILPEPNGVLPHRAERLLRLPQVNAPRIWSRSELKRAISN